MQYDRIALPADGERITSNRDSSLDVPDRPIVPFGRNGFGATVIRRLDD